MHQLRPIFGLFDEAISENQWGPKKDNADAYKKWVSGSIIDLSVFTCILSSDKICLPQLLPQLKQSQLVLRPKQPQVPPRPLAWILCLLFSSAFASSAAEGEFSHYQAKRSWRRMQNQKSIITPDFAIWPPKKLFFLYFSTFEQNYFCILFCNFLQRCNNRCTSQGDKKQSLWEGWQCASKNTMAAKRMICTFLTSLQLTPRLKGGNVH